MTEESSREPKIPSWTTTGKVIDQSVLEKADSSGIAEEQIDRNTMNLIVKASKPFDRTVAQAFSKRIKKIR